MAIMITGGFGFIGNHVVEHFFNKYQDVVVLDALTYASNNFYLKKQLGSKYKNLKRAIVDIRDLHTVRKVIKFYKPKLILNLAAESHVCNSIEGPRVFFETNTMGTFNLLDSVRTLGLDTEFIHVSTDEVFGDLGLGSHDKFSETTPYAPTSPYAASKASADHIARSYFHTYDMPIKISNCTNNFGPNQHVEKLVPRVIYRIVKEMPITIYGSGKQVRDWLYVRDHAQAMDTIFTKGTQGESYCVGGLDERTNVDVIHSIIESVKRVSNNQHGRNTEIVYTKDRPTDDMRYAIDPSKLMKLGWRPSQDFDNKLDETVKWYLDNFEQAFSTH